MSRKIVAGNWKMNTDVNVALELYKTVSAKATDFPNTKIIMSPPAPFLGLIADKCNSEFLAAQDCNENQNGAYTGEWSTSMLKSLNIGYCIIGHSERRSIYGETDQVIFEKLKACLAEGIIPILCIGEQLEEREANKHFDVIKQQMEFALTLSSDEFSKVVIAYEPVWAIGTGKTATSDQAQEIHAFIRDLILANYDNTVAGNTSILYGGSCKPSNADELFAQPDVDGGLIGGASLNAEDFLAIVKANNH